MAKKSNKIERKRPQQKRSESLVESIRTAATRVFSQGPYDNATTTKIAQIAGVSIGSLYQYFPGKDAIVGALIQERTTDQLAKLELILADSSSETLRSTVEKIIRMIAEPAYQASGLSKLFYGMGLYLGAGDTVLEARSKAVLLICSHLHTRKEIFKSEKLEMQVTIVINAVLGAIASSIVKAEDRIELNELTLELTEMTLGYLGAR